jgi:hypothetical protein
MNSLLALSFCIFLSTTLFAENKEKKWIPIQPIESTETRKVDTNQSKVQTINKLHVIKNLLDNIKKEGIKEEEEKSFFSIDEI